MKKLFLLGAVVLWHFPALAQEFRYGVKGGASFSDISGKDLDKNAHNYKLGWHAGVMVNIQYPGTEYFSITPELIYSRKGYQNSSLPFEVRDKNNNLVYKAEQGGLVHLNYLDLPVMFNFKKGLIIFEIGPQLSFLVGSHDDSFLKQTFPDGSELNTPLPQFNKTGLRKIDLGIATGFRLESDNGVAMGLRFNQGLIQLPKQITDVALPPPGFNQCFQLFASYLIPR